MSQEVFVVWEQTVVGTTHHPATIIGVYRNGIEARKVAKKYPYGCVTEMDFEEDE